MVAGLLQLHHDIQERLLLALGPIVKGRIVFGKDIFVVLQLYIGKLDSDNFLGFGRKIGLDLGLGPSEHERLNCLGQISKLLGSCICI